MIAEMQQDESFWGEKSHPRFARFLAEEVFKPPDAYFKANVPFIGKAIKGGKQVDTLYIWDMKGIKGNVHLFYIAQLTPRVVAVMKGKAVHIGPEFVPLRMTRAERRTIGKGEALVFELETEKPAIERAVKRFKMPLSIKGQRIRYGLVFYADQGFAAEPPIRIVFATPVGTGLDCLVVLDALRRVQSANQE